MSRISIDRLKFSNILSFGNVTQEIELKPGLNAIIGRFPGKETSNRAGKTALAEVVSFPLYGKVLKSLKQEQIINWRNRKNCLTEIEFTKDDNNYRIVRGLKPNILEIYHNNNQLPLSSIRDVQKQIEDEIIGITYNTFVNLVYTNSNSKNEPILRMNRQQKRQFIEKLFDLEMFTAINGVCLAKLSSIDNHMVNSKHRIQLNETLIGEYNNQIDNFNKNILYAKQHKDRIIEIDNKLNGYNKKIGIVYGLVVNKLGIYRDREKNLLSQAEAYKNIIKESGEIKEKLVEIKKVVVRPLEDIKRDLIHYGDDTSLYSTSLAHHKELLSGIESLLKSKEEDLKKLIDYKTCPTCLRDIDDEMIYNRIENEIIKLKNDKQKNKESIKKLEYDIEKINKISEELRNTEEHENQINLLFEKLKAYKTIQYDKDRLTRCKKVIDKLSIYLAKLEYNEEKEELLSERDKLVAQIEYIENKGDILQIDNLNENIDKLRIESDSLNKDLVKFGSISDYLSYLKDLCKDDNVKQYAISSIIPYLNSRTNEYLATVGYDFYVKLDKWIDCSIHGPGIINGTYENLSGGESHALDLSLMMAFHDVARLSSPNFFDVMILDEVLDSSMDTNTVTKLVDIVRMKQKQDNLKVFIISHRMEISDMDFDNVYLVENINGFSKVKIL